MSEESNPEARPGDLSIVRDDDFTDLYANNLQFEASVWDLKILCGQLDQSGGSAIIKQHTGMTIPWAQVKLAAYFLMVNAFVHESNNGHITTPASITPLRPDSNDPTASAEGKKTLKYLEWLHDQFFSADPYISTEAE